MYSFFICVMIFKMQTFENPLTIYLLQRYTMKALNVGRVRG